MNRYCCFMYSYNFSNNLQICFACVLILYVYICLFGLGLVLWQTNHCRLFNAESSLYIYIKYIRIDLVGFYGISTIVGY